MQIRLLSPIRLAILLIGLTLCIMGIMRGELTEIMHKAIIICLECIGIG